jgi:hypothetical protein
VSLKESTVDLVDRVVVVWLDTNEDEIGVHVAYDAGVEKFLADCAAPYRGSLRLGRGSMVFPNRPSSAHKFEVGDVVAAHTDGNVTIRKHSSGSFTALVDGEPKRRRAATLNRTHDFELVQADVALVCRTIHSTMGVEDNQAANRLQARR